MILRPLLITLLALAAHVPQAPASEITLSIDHITAAVCAVETGTTWVSPGRVLGSYNRGTDGEAGPWQITGGVLSGLQITRSTGSIHGDVRACERAFRDWYAHLLAVTGSHAEALAAYHRGLKGRNKKSAKEYAQRCLNLAESLSHQPHQQTE